MKHWNKVRCYMLEWQKVAQVSKKALEVHGGSNECKWKDQVKASLGSAWSSGVWTCFWMSRKRGEWHRWWADRPLCQAFILLLNDATFLHLCQCWSGHQPTSSISLWFSLLQLASEQDANSQVSQNSLSSIAWRWKWARDWHEDQGSSNVSSLLVTLMFYLGLFHCRHYVVELTEPHCGNHSSSCFQQSSQELKVSGVLPPPPATPKAPKK